MPGFQQKKNVLGFNSHPLLIVQEQVGVFGSFPWEMLLRALEVRTINRGIFPHILSVEKVTHQKAGRKTGRSWEKLEEMPGCS